MRAPAAPGAEKSGHHFAGVRVIAERGAPIQRALGVSAPSTATPAGAVGTNLGIPQTVISVALGAVKPLPRARTATADVTAATIRDEARKKSPVLATINGMAHGEQLISRGAAWNKFYDAGHLIGDQLIGKSLDSFVLGNLAPQASGFNTGPYVKFENNVREAVEAAELAGENPKVKLAATVAYGADLTTTGAELNDRGIIDAVPVGDGKQKYAIGTKTVPTSTYTRKFRVPRRIPESWNIEATGLGIDTGRVAPTPTRNDERLGVRARAGSPYKWAATANVNSASLKVNQFATRTRPEDILSLVASRFPQFDTPAAIIKQLELLLPNFSPVRPKGPARLPPSSSPDRARRTLMFSPVRQSQPTSPNAPVTSTPSLAQHKK